jgi:hypothetical protein
MNKDTQLAGTPYGVAVRRNKAGMTQMQADVDANLSIFDDQVFVFYLIKYAEFLGVQSLI